MHVSGKKSSKALAMLMIAVAMQLSEISIALAQEAKDNAAVQKSDTADGQVRRGGGKSEAVPGQDEVTKIIKPGKSLPSSSNLPAGGILDPDGVNVRVRIDDIIDSALLSEVQIESVPDLDIVIVKGPKKDVDRVLEFMNQVDLTDGYIVQLISKFKQIKLKMESSHPVFVLISSRLKQLALGLEGEIEQLNNARVVLQKSRDYAAAMSQEYESIYRDIILNAAKVGGVPVPDTATLNELMKNCHLELQRIEWDIATERTLAKEPIDPNRLKALKQKLFPLVARIEAADARVKNATIQEKVSKELVTRNAESKSQYQIVLGELVSESAALNVARADLTAAESQIEAEISTPSTESARKLSSLSTRQDLIRAQLNRFQEQRIILESAQLKAKERDLSSDRKMELGREIDAHDLRTKQREMLLNTLRQVLVDAPKPLKP